ncbi:MAG: FliM/FliN family flagellar motor switch protein [Planctomycetes bacterium]|nr:FliM/FliN family flagellar motor switch protein [Planctomycetota bacterium]
MSISQADIDALLSSASDLADEFESDGGGPAKDSAGSPAGTSATPPPESSTPAATVFSPEARRLLRLKVPVIVQLAESEMSIEKVLQFTVGTIVEFDRSADSELELIVNNVSIGTGNAVKCGENFGLRVISIDPQRRRAEAAMQKRGGERSGAPRGWRSKKSPRPQEETL